MKLVKFTTTKDVEIWIDVNRIESVQAADDINTEKPGANIALHSGHSVAVKELPAEVLRMISATAI